MRARENDYNNRTQDSVYFGVGSFGKDPTRAGCCCCWYYFCYCCCCITIAVLLIYFNIDFLFTYKIIIDTVIK